MPVFPFYPASSLVFMPRDMEIFLCSLSSPNPSFHLFGMVEIAEWPSKTDFPKKEGNPGRKEAESGVEIVQGPELKPFHRSRDSPPPASGSPAPRTRGLFSKWLACSPPDFLPGLWPGSHQGFCHFLASQKRVCYLVS